MKRHLCRMTVAWLVAALCLATSLVSEAQTKAGVSPKSLTLGLVFQGAPEPVADHFRPLLEYTTRKLDPAGTTKGNVVVAPSAVRLIKLLQEKRVDFYLESPLPTFLINRSGNARLLLRRWKSGMSDYRSVIFTSKASGIARLDNLRGKMIAFEDAGSTSGYFLPKLLLFKRGFAVVEKPGIEAKVSAHEIGYIFAASDKNIVNLLLQDKVAAGAMSNDDYEKLDEANKARLTIIAESESLPRHLLSVGRNLPKPLVKRLRETLLSMHHEEEGQRILRQTDDTTKFDTLPGGEEAFRRKLMELYRPRGRD